MKGEDITPGIGEMAIGTRLIIRLAKIGQRIDGHRVCPGMSMLGEISTMAMETIARALSRVTVGPGAESPGAIGMALIAGAVGSDRSVVDAGYNVAGMTTNTVSGGSRTSGCHHPIMILNQMVGIIYCLGGVAIRAIDRNGHRIGAATIMDRVDHLLAAVGMAKQTIAPMNPIDPSHIRHRVAAGTRSDRAQHIMIGVGRRDRMVELILRPMTVGAILWNPRLAIDNGVDNLLTSAGMTFDADIILARDSHDVDHPGCPRI